MDYDIAWSVNRTQAVRRLRELNQTDLATHYNTYYEAGWASFLSDWHDEDAGREAFAAAVRALRLGAALGRDSGLVQGSN